MKYIIVYIIIINLISDYTYSDEYDQEDNIQAQTTIYKDTKASKIIIDNKGSKLILTHKKNSAGIWQVSGVAYYMNSRTVFSHTDENDDGILETCVFYPPDTGFEETLAYKKDENEKYAPVSAVKLNEIKEMLQDVSNFFDMTEDKSNSQDK
ncbi:MAG: hypothetical protein AAGA64_18410 [Bacteroidota bacterium]